MTTATRGTKTAGGTNFTSGTTILNDEVDTDFNNIITVVNGNIDNANVSASADVALTKLADHGTLATVESVGKDGANPPTTLADEITALRYEIAQLKYGNATDQAGVIDWFERSPNFLSNPRSILYNGSFEVFTGSGSTTAPNGWAATTTPATTYGHEINAQADAVGLGYRLKITGAGSANTGVRVTIAAASLRASTTYLCYAMAKATAGDTARMYTEDADVELDVETTSTSMILLQGFFTTDATPTPVIFHCVSKGASDVTYWDHVYIVPMVATSRTTGYVASFLQLETPATAGFIIDAEAANNNVPALGAGIPSQAESWTDGTTALDANVICPGSGYVVKVQAMARYTFSASLTQARIMLFKTVDAGSNWTMVDGADVSPGTSSIAGGQSVTLQYIDVAPTPGVQHRFAVYAAAETGTLTPQGAATSADGHGVSSILVELIPAGS